MSETVIAVHEERLTNMQERLVSLETKVDAIIVTLAEIRGGWRTIVALSSIVGAVVGALFSMILGKVL